MCRWGGCRGRVLWGLAGPFLAPTLPGAAAAPCQGLSHRAWVPSRCPHPDSGQAQHVCPTGPQVAFGKRAARSRAWLWDWLSALCQACPGVLSPATPPALGRAVAVSPGGTEPLPTGPARAQAWDRQLLGSHTASWCGRAGSLPPLLSSRGEGCRPGPEERCVFLQLLPPLRPPAKREPLLLAGQPAHAGLLRFFTCCVLAVRACPQRGSGVQPHGLLSPGVWSSRGLPCVAGSLLRCREPRAVTPGDPLPATRRLRELLPRVAAVAQRWPLTYSLGDAAQFFADLFKRLLSRCTM